MKNLLVASVSLLASAALFAQQKQPGTTPAKTPVKPVAKPVIKLVNSSLAPLKTLNDSASYSIGLSIASFCKQHNIPKPNTVLIARSINDVETNKAPLLNDQACNNVINQILSGQKVVASKAPLNSKVPLPTQIDSVSYAIGFNHANFFRQQGIEKLNTTIVNKAVTDVLANKPAIFDDRTANFVLNKIIIQKQEEKIKPTIDAGRAFLATNKQRPGVKTTASGLQYEVIKEGTGIKPTASDTFVCNYKGSLIDGTEFDNSYKRNQPLVYPVGAVIRGWTEGLQLMPVGSNYKFYIPFELGYGPFGSPPAIPGGAVLIFDVELLDVKVHKSTDQIK